MTDTGTPHTVQTATGRTTKIAIAEHSGEILSLVAPDHLAPGAETITIYYAISDLGSIITGGKIRVLRARDGKLVTERALTEAERSEGVHSISWDGSFFPGTDPDKEFPDGFLDVASSPYEIHLSVTAKGHAAGPRSEAKAPIAVEVSSIVLELGPREWAAVGGAADERLEAAVHDLGSLPAPGDLKRLTLRSNLFGADHLEMHDVSKEPASFKAHRDDDKFGWGDGPRIPILAGVRFRTSTGGEALAPKAWGKQQVLWAVHDATKDHVQAPGASAFIMDALDYHASGTDPAGAACHHDRGGKRGESKKTLVPTKDLPKSFPFGIQASKTLPNSGAVTGPAKDGTYAGKTGIVFQPSRMAGDTYKVTAYFNPTAALDKAKMPGGTLEKSTGFLQIWRRVEVSLYWRKQPRGTAPVVGRPQQSRWHMPVADDYPIATVDWGAVKAYYEPACIEIDTRHTKMKSGDQESYDAAFTAAMQAHVPDEDVRDALFGPGSPYLQAHYAVYFMPRDSIESDIGAAKLKSVLVAADEDKPDASDYQRHFEDLARDIAIDAVKTLDDQSGVTGGLHIFHFSYFENTSGSPWLGWTPPVSRHQGRVLLAGNDKDVSSTLAHEAGHSLFLSHAPLGVQGDANLHDPADTKCLMGYEDGSDHFCGMCNLKLRGWKYSELSNTVGNNSAKD